MKLWEFIAFPLYLGLTVPCNSATRANKRLQFFIFSHYSDKPEVRLHKNDRSISYLQLVTDKYFSRNFSSYFPMVLQFHFLWMENQ